MKRSLTEEKSLFLSMIKQIQFFLWILFIFSGSIFLVWPAVASSNGERSVEAVEYRALGKRDPFVPLVAVTTRDSRGLVGVENSEEVRIEGVVYDPKKGSVVIVNGSVLREGQESGSVKVVKIKPEGVVVSVNGVESYKPLYQDSAKK